jgi:cation transport regulator ChaC
MDNYIFGYGSLICSDSRDRTGQTGEAIAVTALDISRSWSVPVEASKTTAVGALESAGSQCNGVIFPVSDDNLEKFDIREVGYDRIILPPERFTRPSLIPKGTQVWTYVGHRIQQPTCDMPIAQSYLDVIINGCMQFGQEYVEDFFRLTQHWGHLVDDRHAPVYKRPITTHAHHEQFDALLAKMIPAQLANRRKL